MSFVRYCVASASCCLLAHSRRWMAYSATLYEEKKWPEPKNAKAKKNGAECGNGEALPDEAAGAGAPPPEAYRALLHDLLLYRRETLVPVVAALQKERKLLDKRLEELDEKVEQLSQIREEIRSLVTQHKLEEQVELQKVLNKTFSTEEKKQSAPAPRSRSHNRELKF